MVNRLRVFGVDWAGAMGLLKEYCEWDKEYGTYPKLLFYKNGRIVAVYDREKKILKIGDDSD